jgi:GT2 family glycosyltransferase
VDSFGGVINWDDYSLNHIQDLSLTEKLKPGLEYAPGTAFYIHKKTLEKIGKMDTAFHTYWEDVDFSMRAHRDGIPIFRNPEAKLLHGIGKTCHKKPFYSLFLYQRNRLKFFERYLSPEEFSLAAEKIKPELENLYAQWSGRGDKNRVAMLEEIFSLYYGAAKNG